MPELRIDKIDHHRNGVAGERFYIVHFRELVVLASERQFERQMMAVVFPPDPVKTGPQAGDPDWSAPVDACRVAVFDIALLPDTRFAAGNSWRGDHYARPLYDAISPWEHQPEPHAPEVAT